MPLTYNIATMGKVHQEDNDTKEKKTEFSLVQVKGTWKRKVGKKAKKESSDCVSAAKMWVEHFPLSTFNPGYYNYRI